VGGGHRLRFLGGRRAGQQTERAETAPHPCVPEEFPRHWLPLSTGMSLVSGGRGTAPRKEGPPRTIALVDDTAEVPVLLIESDDAQASVDGNGEETGGRPNVVFYITKGLCGLCPFPRRKRTRGAM